MTPSEMMQSMVVFNKYKKFNGCDDFFHAEHDIINTDCYVDDIPENSADGRYLGSLGWHVDSGTDLWSHFT